MQAIKLFQYQFKFLEMSDILELIKRGESSFASFGQIISLNPENLMAMFSNKQFEKVVLASRGQITDGVGIVLAAQTLTGKRLERLPGVEVMDRLIGEAERYSLRCLLIGGEAGLADDLVNCYKERYPKLKINGFQAIANIKKPTAEEISALKRIVSLERPHLVFAAFGSPAQELWLEQEKELFRGALLMGVGGAFAMLSGRLARAPRFVRALGGEWLYRLFKEPWRWRRQLALWQFSKLVLREKLKKI